MTMECARAKFRCRVIGANGWCNLKQLMSSHKTAISRPEVLWLRIYKTSTTRQLSLSPVWVILCPADTAQSIPQMLMWYNCMTESHLKVRQMWYNMYICISMKMYVDVCRWSSIVVIHLLIWCTQWLKPGWGRERGNRIIWFKGGDDCECRLPTITAPRWRCLWGVYWNVNRPHLLYPYPWSTILTGA